MVPGRSNKISISWQAALLLQEVPTTTYHSPLLSLPFAPTSNSRPCCHFISWIEEPKGAKRVSLLPQPNSWFGSLLSGCMQLHSSCSATAQETGWRDSGLSSLSPCISGRHMSNFISKTVIIVRLFSKKKHQPQISQKAHCKAMQSSGKLVHVLLAILGYQVTFLPLFSPCALLHSGSWRWI